MRINNRMTDKKMKNVKIVKSFRLDKDLIMQLHDKKKESNYSTMTKLVEDALCQLLNSVSDKGKDQNE